MPGASLEIGSPAWRAGRACACMGALLQGTAPADDVLGALADLGEPPEGWWDVLGSARSAGGVTLLLPRPGDPRGLALPRGLAPDAALGWIDDKASGSVWMVPDTASGWIRVSSPLLTISLPHPDEALRELRKAVVDAAHTVDALVLDPRNADGRARQDREALVDSWILGPPALPPATRPLAVLGLRMLLALEPAHALVDTIALDTIALDTIGLEQRARSAVESAFSSVTSSG